MNEIDKLLPDKEVGELWRKWQDGYEILDNRIIHYHAHFPWMGNVFRKLVAERVKQWEPIVAMRGIAPGFTLTTLALQDFGIDPATWPS